MSEYVKKVSLLEQAVEVEYLGRPRLMVSAAKIGLMPAIEVVHCSECRWWNDYGCAIDIKSESDKPKATDFCSFGEKKNG